MEGYIANPARSGEEFLLQFLGLKVIDSNSLPCRDEKVRFGRVETSGLRKAFEALEGVLGLVF